MKTPLYLLILSAAVLFVMVTNEAQALPMTSYQKLLKSSDQYRAADAELNAVWKETKQRMNAKERTILLKEQRVWLRQTRDARAKELMATLPKDAAYAKATLERIQELQEKTYGSSRTAVRPVSLQENTSNDADHPLNERFIDGCAVRLVKACHQAARSLAEAEAQAETAFGALPPSDSTDPSLAFLDTTLSPAMHRRSSVNLAESQPSPTLCDAFKISKRLYYGHYVPRPFVSLNLQVKKGRKISSLKVNNYEIRKNRKYSKQLPQWRRYGDRVIDLNLFTDTILNDISIVYTDGTVCTIDNINIQKDMTNPYN